MFVDCLRGLMEEFIEAKNLNCTLLWIQSMQGISRHDNTTANLPICKTYEEYSSVEGVGYSFAQDASSYSHSKCPGNCYQRKTFENIRSAKISAISWKHFPFTHLLQENEKISKKILFVCYLETPNDQSTSSLMWMA